MFHILLYSLPNSDDLHGCRFMCCAILPYKMLILLILKFISLKSQFGFIYYFPTSECDNSTLEKDQIVNK